MAAKQAPKPQAKAKEPQLCKVSFGYQEWILPVEKGLALVGLLKDAVAVEYARLGKDGPQYAPKPSEDLRLVLEVIKPGQFLPAGSTLH